MSTARSRQSELKPPKLRAAIDRVLSARGQPAAWSVIVTVLGDAIEPRGGRIWTGSLIEILGLIGYSGGVLRTALSRLVADGWVEGSKAGRRSFYELTAKGHAETAVASRRIYSIAAPAWDGRWQIAILTDTSPERRAELRQKLAAQRFASANPDTLVQVHRDGPGSLARPGIALFDARLDDADAARALAARAWSLEPIAADYAALEHTLAPLLAASVPASDEGSDALAARLLLIHELRRVVLRDPGLPAKLLPPSWIGARVRARIGARYRELLPASEAWLAGHAEGDHGALPQADAALASRFSV